jgi:hypothetical protein
MAREGPSHRVMSEAFEKRLKQLFPESEYHYSFGKQLANGLKPDVYIRHPDGRQWAYEMVHGNSHPAHLNKNHHRYLASGIQDIWILWDDLRPRIGVPLSMRQGVFMDLFPSDYTIAESKLTAPQRCILNMQSQSIRYLYSFSVTPLVPELYVDLLNMLSIGINSYAFRSLGQSGAFHVTKSFIPMVELGFNENGFLQDHPNPAFNGIEVNDLLKALGYETDQSLIPSSVMKQITEMIKTPDGYPQLLRLYLSNFIQKASPELLAEFYEIKNASASQSLKPFSSSLNHEIGPQILNDPSALHALADEGEAAQSHIDGQTIPPIVKQFIIDLLNQSAVRSSAEWMEWQAANPTLDEARALAKKIKK